MTPEEAREAFMAAMRDPDASSIAIGQDILLEQGWKLWEMGEWAQKYGAVQPDLDRGGKVPSHFGDDNIEGAIVSHGMFALKKNYSAEWIVNTEEQPWGDALYRVVLFVRFEEFRDASIVIPPISISDGRYWPEIEAARIEAAKAAWAELALIKRGYRERWSGDRFNRATPSNMELPAEINPAKMAPKRAFWNAVADPDPSSMEVAQDIALENGWKLWQLGEERAKELGEFYGWDRPKKEWLSVGSFWYTTELGHDNGCDWKITTPASDPGRMRRFVINMFFEYQTKDRLRQWTWESGGAFISLQEAAAYAARYAWYALKVMKNGDHDHIDAARVHKLIEGQQPDLVPRELNPTDPAEAIAKALRDPDPSSIEIAQDIALENDWTLVDIGHEEGIKHGTGRTEDAHFGEFFFDGKYGEDGVAWHVQRVAKAASRTDLRIRYIVTWCEKPDQRGPSNTEKTFPVTYAWSRNERQPLFPEIAAMAAETSWRIVRFMKRQPEMTYEQMKLAVMDIAGWNYMHARATNAKHAHELDEEVPQELVKYGKMTATPYMPKKKNPDDLAAAREKYLEFHRYDPKDVGSFPSSFTIPKKMLCAGKGKWVTYRSSKVDPSTLKKPKRPIDYIHEHDAGVKTYLTDEYPDTEVPEKFRDVSALVRLGQCLGFCIIDADGDEVEAEGTTPLPELYCSPDGKCLYVIQDKKKVIAMSWGGALGVFARGIDG